MDFNVTPFEQNDGATFAMITETKSCTTSYEILTNGITWPVTLTTIPLNSPSLLGSPLPITQKWPGKNREHVIIEEE